MAKLILVDENIAALYSFQGCATTQAAQAQLIAQGWTNIEAMKHIDAAIDAGAYRKNETYPTRQERIVRVTGETQGEDK